MPWTIMVHRPSDSRLFADPVVTPDFAFEAAARAAGRWPVAGLDEAGRGPLAGPVVAAAVILDPDAVPSGLDDSKRLSPVERSRLFELILATANVAIASSSSRHIDGTDIRKASLDAMRRALAGLPVRPAHALVDGRDLPEDLMCTGEAVIKGDSRSVSIAAASIVAKVTRDRMMQRIDPLFPTYGFGRHAGYATRAHRMAIAEWGACPLHRMSFRPLRPGGE